MDVLDRLLIRMTSLTQAAPEIGIRIVDLSDILAGRRVAKDGELAKISEWSGRSVAEIAGILAQRVQVRLADSAARAADS